MKKLIIGLIALLVVGGVASLLFPSVNGTGGLPFINYQDAFVQEPGEYFVYFYNTDCRFCQELEPSIMEAHRAGVPIFVVDVAASENDGAWYDWDAHHERYTTVVGEVVDGEENFFEDYHEDMFPAAEGWAIRVEGEELVAVNNRANFNMNPQTPEEIEVPGTPSMMRIVNGQSAGFVVGVEESRGLLAQYSGLDGALFQD